MLVKFTPKTVKSYLAAPIYPTNHRDCSGGYLIIYVMVLTFVTMSIGLSVLRVSGAQYAHAIDDVYRQNVAHGARACAAIVAEKISEDPSFSGYSDQVIFDDLNSSQGRVVCSAAVASGPGDTKNINVTSVMQRFVDDPRPISYKMRAVLGGGSEKAIIDSYRL